ncbi:laccase 14 [Perilla frutescens var. hirtella]|nr:laccase 14 [Perilla frutescens var. hirtella]
MSIHRLLRHGVKQPRYPWSDGPEYITQCPIQPGSNFSQKIVLSDEIGTLWWHAHSDWSRATVHGALIVYPRQENDYPFPLPDAEIPIVLGEWWKSDVQAVLNEFIQSGGDPNVSDAFLINGQPGDLYPCSSQDTFTLSVDYGKTYLIRMVNAVLNTIMFFKIADHNVTIVGSDGAYLKPFTSDYITISPGQTIDFLLLANQSPSHYYMASSAYAVAGDFDNTTTTARVEYSGYYTLPSSPALPVLPNFTDTLASVNFTARFRSLAYKNHPIDVPLNVTTNLLFVLSINTQTCPNSDCAGPLGNRFAASVNNITFRSPRTAILHAYYEQINGVYSSNFPSNPPFPFNYTADSVPQILWESRNGTRVRVLEYNSTVELVFQGTNTLNAPIDHPMHLHGHSFYVVGWGFGNFNRTRDPLNYNLVDPPLQNTIAVPRSGWTAIRFLANNPGVWLMHCHFERHISWGMEMVFITTNGKGPNATMLPPPSDFPMC